MRAVGGGVLCPPAGEHRAGSPALPVPPQLLPASATCSRDSNAGDMPGTEDAVSHSRHIHSSWAVRS